MGSSNCSAESTDLIEPDTADMYGRDICWEKDTNSQKKSRKKSKNLRDDFKYHKRISPTTKPTPSVLDQYYWNKIDQLKAENWRISASPQFEKVFKNIHVATSDGFKRHHFPKIYFMDNTKDWSHIREETSNQQIDNMVKIVKLRRDSIASSKHLKDVEIFYIFKCLKHIFWDTGFQAQIYMTQEGKKKFIPCCYCEMEVFL